MEVSLGGRQGAMGAGGKAGRWVKQSNPCKRG
jgi:hypothetical protein